MREADGANFGNIISFTAEFRKLIYRRRSWGLIAVRDTNQSLGRFLRRAGDYIDTQTQTNKQTTIFISLTFICLSMF